MLYKMGCFSCCRVWICNGMEGIFGNNLRLVTALILMSNLWCTNSVIADNNYDNVILISDSGGDNNHGTFIKCILTDSLNCNKFRSSSAPRFPVYDPTDDIIYWTDYKADTICKVGWSGMDFTDRWIKLSGNPSGLAIDPRERVLFTHDGDLKRVDIDTKDVTVISASADWGTITLDIVKRRLFLAESDANRIRLFSYDGTPLATVKSRISDPRGMAYSLTENKLFFCDKESETLESVDLTTNKTSIMADRGPCLSVALLDSTLYFTHHGESNKVYGMSVSGGNESSYTYSGSVSEWMRLAAFKRCLRGRYGPSCSSTCGHCLLGEDCSAFDGVCVSGCDPGWSGDNCDIKCPEGTRGEQCDDECGYCSDSDICHHVHGACPNGCKPGYTGELCLDECDDGYYGSGCNMTCSQCSVPCSKDTGSCPGTCLNGWTGLTCDTVCGEGRYGEDCRESCGQCDGVCDAVTGHCNSTCMPGWIGRSCDQECLAGTFGKECAYICGQCATGTSCNTEHGACQQGCRGGWAGEKCDRESKATVWILAAVCVALFLIIIALIIFVIYKNRSSRRRNINGLDEDRDIRNPQYQPFANASF